MKAVEFLGGSASRLVTKEVPAADAGHVVVKVAYNSICGSDLWLYKGQWHGSGYPIVPGHEWSGTVVEASGEGAGWRGRRVVGELATGCGTCAPCRAGDTVMCPDLAELGFTYDGAMADYVRVPVANLHAIPDVVSDLDACQVEPLAVALHAIKRVNVQPGQRVAVLGCGAIGLLLLQAARAAGGNVQLATDPIAYRRTVAESLGAAASADPGADDLSAWNDSFDVVLEASGDPTSVRAALRIAAPTATIGLVGYQVGRATEIETASWPLKMLTVVGVMGPRNFYRSAIDLLARKLVDLSPILTTVEPLESHESSIRRAIDRETGVVRVVFELT